MVFNYVGPTYYTVYGYLYIVIVFFINLIGDITPLYRNEQNLIHWRCPKYLSFATQLPSSLSQVLAPRLDMDSLNFDLGHRALVAFFETPGHPPRNINLFPAEARCISPSPWQFAWRPLCNESLCDLAFPHLLDRHPSLRRWTS
jgi:hypothetical protein